jgi:hypothetical protein
MVSFKRGLFICEREGRGPSSSEIVFFTPQGALPDHLTEILIDLVDLGLQPGNMRIDVLASAGLGDLAAADTACADAQASGGAVYERSDCLKIGLEDPPRAVIGVTDVVAEGRPLAADFANPGHGCAPLVQ